MEVAAVDSKLIGQLRMGQQTINWSRSGSAKRHPNCKRRKFQPVSTATSTTTTTTTTAATATTNSDWYDVYLSFCDDDTLSFALGIYKGLSLKRIDVFWENEEIRSGDHGETATVLDVIGNCKLVLIVFSTNYFNSRRCLQELEKITECCRTTDSLMVLTFFYDGVRLSFGVLKRGMFGGEAYHEFLDRICEEEISQQGDKFMSWVAPISHNKSATYAGTTFFGHKFMPGEESDHIDIVADLIIRAVNAFCGSREWFGEGSKVIITTRDRKLLKEHGVDHIYKVKELDESESLELFNSKAFSQATSQEAFAELSRQVVSYSRGLPLALKELASVLYGRTISNWESVLYMLKMFPQEDVQRILEDSFNDLNDEEKQVFLDIAYFFIGKNQNDVLQTLNRSTQRISTLQISLLEDKSLLTIDENNMLQMHVLLQATARYIILREPSNKPDQ
ncbi:NBS-LRR resistance protein, partial [Trifolium medium]|nr:NBS-LRR resistance protein [Trifolium medium]